MAAAAPGESESDDAANPVPRLETVIAGLCAGRLRGATICPTDAAKAFAEARGEDELGWRSHLGEVRRTAVRLALEGRLVIYRKGKWSTRGLPRRLSSRRASAE